MISDADAAVVALVGRTIAGKYVIDSFIGGGAMGSVYKARQTSLEKVVAIKVLRPALAGDKLFAARFHREAKAASKLDHPNSLRIFDYGEEPDGLLYIVMEYLEGRSLFRLLQEEWPIAHDRVVNIVSQVLAALAVAHDEGILHRDLKPENIMVASRVNDEGQLIDHVKVCDFGIAKIVSGSRAENDAPTELHTSEGLVVGTPEYMSPEQGKGDPLDPRSDLYSVGVILYQMLSNQVPFEADTPLGTVMRHIMEEPRPPSHHFAGAAGHIENVALRAMQKDRASRFQSAREMRAELRSAFGPSAPLVMPGPPRAVANGPTLHGFPRPASSPLFEHRPSGVPTRRIDVAPPFDDPRGRAQAAVGTERLARTEPPPESANGQSGEHGTLALLASSVLPPPRPRSRFWPIASGVLILASTAFAGLIATGTSLRGVAGGSAAPTRELRVVDRTEKIAPRQATANRAPRSPIRDVAPAPSASSSAAPPVPAVPAVPGRPQLPAPSRTPRATAPDAERASVGVGAVSAVGLDEAVVRKLLDRTSESVNRCYRDAVTRGTTKVQGTATLAMETDGQGKIAKASLKGLALPASTSSCIVGAVRNAHVDDDATGFGVAEATLSFTIP